jgi:membrane associated rhomboid family serine protease
MIPLRDNAPAPEQPVVTLSLIVVNTLIYLTELGNPEGVSGTIRDWGLQPARIWAGGHLLGTTLPAWVTLVTSTFLHFGLWHLAANMLFLWIVGRAVEWLCGPWRFLLLYMACGVFASGIGALLGGHSTLAAAGASGAIAGVMAAYALVFPRARILNFYASDRGRAGLFWVSSFWLVGIWVAQELFRSIYAFYSAPEGPYGAYAHLAGALVGLALVYPLRDRSQALPLGLGWRRDAFSPRLVMMQEAAVTDLSPALVDREQQRIRQIDRTYAPFDERPVRALIAQGDYAGAKAHCELMLQQATADDNLPRIRGYERLLAEIRQRWPGMA